MNILFVSNNFPPEVNAPATRLVEHARAWVREGHTVEVLTSPPNFPEGRVYDGYRNRFTHERLDDIRVTRVPMYVSANEGAVRRSASYASFLLSGSAHLPMLQTRPDVVVATSPQLFAGMLGWVIARALRIPFVLEIRDLWPESIIAVGASKKRNAVIKGLEAMERFLYENADHIVVVTHSFKVYIVNKGIPGDKITVLMNGADLSSLAAPDPAEVDALKRELGIENKFTAGYIGTIGLAHRADVLHAAAHRCPDPDVVFMVVGTGAERKKLEALAQSNPSPCFRLIDKQPKSKIPALLAATNVSVVHLKDEPLFRTVIPSKIFEAMATRTPIVLGVEGETKKLIERAQAGIPVTPEDPDAMVEAVLKLKNDPELYREMGERAHAYVHEHHDRENLARRYAALLASTVGGASRPVVKYA